jgi:glucan 1,4-alpha-glucosidase
VQLRHRTRSAAAAAVLAGGVLAAPGAVPAATAAPAPPAPGGPGATSHQDLSRKDCVGTARTAQSTIWFTVANGVLSDVYAPTVDATNVETMQYVVTDGATFTDLQTRDTTYTATADPTGMVCTVTSTAKNGTYRFTTTYLTDPARDSVIVHTQFQPLTAAAARDQVYVRLDASAGGNGGGGAANGGADTAVVDTTTGLPVPVSYDTATTSQANRTAYAVPSYLALRADLPFRAVSSGYVGTATDGLTQLDNQHALGPVTTTATNGNVEQTAQLNTHSDGTVNLALGFGTTQAAAVTTAGETLRGLPQAASSYVGEWRTYDAGLRAPNLAATGLTAAQRATATRAYYQSANVVKASEDKTYPGAIVAGLDAPWGQAIPADDPGDLFHSGYREVFSRDLYEAWTALYTDGDLATARDTVRFLLLRAQQPDGSEPRNSLVDGTKAADAFNMQLDESSYPILMALQSGLAGDAALWPHIRAMANFLVAHGPSFGVERWEEQTGYSPSTIAAEIAGLVAAGTIAQQQGDPAAARTYLATADQFQRSVKAWGVTTTGPLSSQPYFIRLSKTGDPNAAISYNLGNGGPTLDQRAVVDAGFLEYVRLGELPATDPDVLRSLPVVDATIGRQTANGPGWLRYNGDGYGDCVAGAGTSCTITGAPWANGYVGTGHPWPVLGVERAQQDLATGRGAAAAAQLATVTAENSGPGLVPEQVWDYPDLPPSPYGTDPTVASIGFASGRADGSASPLTWGAGAQVRLTADLAAGTDLEQPAQVRDRYVTHPQGTTPLTVTAPADGSSVGTSTTVTGTAAPGATVDVAAVATDANDVTTHATTTADGGGAFSLTTATGAGTNVLVVSSTAPDGGTAQTTRTVGSDVVTGTLLYSVADPTGDDHGPGWYAYPTAADFHPGAFDLTRFEVYDTGTTVTFRVQTRDLTPTFGPPNGAQLVDVYVRDPAATATSTAPSYPGMNVTVSPWSRLIEVQGFGNQKFVGPDGGSVGAVASSADSASRYITFSVDKAALGGTPGSGWGFTVTLTGQDGTHGTDQTRAFTGTPGGYTFGVCATNDGSPRCTADPGTVPKVMDTLTPAGVSQADELDYTRHAPVALAAVSLP